jgi:ribosomal protein L7/L12
MNTLILLASVLCAGVLLMLVVLAVVVALQNRQSELDHTSGSLISPQPVVDPTPGTRLTPYDRVKGLLRQGNRIEAVKAYREATGASLSEADDAVDRIERGINGSQETDLDDTPVGDLRDRVIDLLRKGRKIEAIKIYRDATGEGLKESKDAVEAIEGTL